MKGKGKTRILPFVMSIVLVLGLISGICAPMALAAEEPADKSILAYALSQARQAVEDGTVNALMPEVKARFDAALAAAETVYADPAATGEEIQKSYTDLQEAFWQFSYKKADKAALTAAIARAEATDLTGYSAAKVKAVSDALTAAKALSGKEGLSVLDQPTVDAAAKALISALDASDNAGGNTGGGSAGGGSTKPTEPEKPAEAGPVTERFPDVKAGAWYVNEVQYVVDNGLMQGTSEGFSPEMKMSRAMLMTVLYRMAGAPEQVTGGGAWYAAPMAWARNAGITDGASPEGDITREQIAVLLYRYAKGNAGSGDLNVFHDAANVSDWARDAMAWAVSEGLFQGNGSGMLNPQGTASRAEVATLLSRFDQMSKKVKEGTR